MNDPTRKSIPKIVWEALVFGIMKKEVPRQYFHGMMYRRHVTHYYRYLSRREYRRLRELVDRPETIPILRDKLRFQNHFDGSAGIRLPIYLGHTEDGLLYTCSGDELAIGSTSMYTAAERIMSLARLHGSDRFFAKPRMDYGGRGAYLIETSRNSNFQDAIANESYIFQLPITQHPSLQRIYPHSINTMRVMVYIDREGKPSVGCTLIRFGSGGGFVDNATSGGFFGGVDPETGRIVGSCTSFFGTGARSYSRHPDTGIPLDGYEIPLFDDALKMALAASEHLPYPLVGWDVAITTEGPVLVEGNDNADYHFAEIACGPFARNPRMSAFIRELTNGEGL